MNKRKKNNKWKKMPKGWNSKSRKSFYKSMGKSINKCIEKIKVRIDDPGAFCASLSRGASANERINIIVDIEDLVNIYEQFICG